MKMNLKKGLLTVTVIMGVLAFPTLALAAARSSGAKLL